MAEVKYEKCEICGQWINLEINHYVVVEDEKSRRHYLHNRPCQERYFDDRYGFVIEEHVNQHR